MFIPIRQNNVFSEAEIASYLSTIFIAFIIIGVLSITSVLPVMLNVRDMFYRHKAAQMLESSSVGRALATAEKRFIIIASFLFCVVFVPVSGIMGGETGNEGYWIFDSITLNIYFQSPNITLLYVYQIEELLANPLHSGVSSLSTWQFIHTVVRSLFLNRIVSAV